MGAIKHPPTPLQLETLDQAANILDRSIPRQDWLYKAYKTLRYTGMHSSALYRPEANAREIQAEGTLIIRWSRPMKGAKKGIKNNWKEVQGIPKSTNIDFDIGEFYQANLRSKRKPGTWKVYIHDRIKKFGEANGIPGLSPNSLRHSMFIILGREMGLTKGDISVMTGTSIRTINQYYETEGMATVTQRMRSKGW